MSFGISCHNGKLNAYLIVNQELNDEVRECSTEIFRKHRWQ